MSELRARSKKVLAQGFTSPNSKRHTEFIDGVYPDYLDRAEGPYVYDTEGKRYIDFIGALGANVLGYRNPKVMDAAKKQIETGYVSGSLPNPIEIQLAEKIQDMFHVERVRFLKTGNEATLGAVRMARNATGRRYILSQGYHGHGDLWTCLSPPARGVEDAFAISKYDPNELMSIQQEAAIIMETLELDDGEERKQEVRKICDTAHNRGVLVIHDEVISGCRVEEYAISRHWDLDPDIVVLGKGLANGFPLSVIAGKKEILDQDYFVSSTFSSEAVSLAASLATLEELSKKNMKDYVFYAKRLQSKINEIVKPLDFQIKGYGTRGMLPTTQSEQVALFMQETCRSGLLFGKAYFVSMAHIEAGLEEYIGNLISDIVNRIVMGSVKLEGTRPTETFKRFA